MYHSITIGEKNTWTDWHLIPASRPLVNPPNVRSSFIEIPGSDGSVDLTDVMIGRATFGDRVGSWEFYVDNGHAPWSDLYSEIMAYLHGKKLRAVLEDDPLFYYDGRFFVNQWRSNASNSMIVINYEVGPYKMYSVSDGDRWLWDPFNFDTGVIKSYRGLTIKRGEALNVTVDGDTKEIIPVIYAQTDNIHLVFVDGHNRQVILDLKKGTHEYRDLIITEGTNTFSYTYTGSNSSTKVSMEMTGGRL